MKLLFKQRFISRFYSYDICGEDGETLYIIKGQLSSGHSMEITDSQGNEVGMVKEGEYILLPEFELYRESSFIGRLKKKFSFLKPRYELDCMGWYVKGNLIEWNYRVVDRTGQLIATVSKQIFNWTDTYVIDVYRSQDALSVILLVLAINEGKCSRWS